MRGVLFFKRAAALRRRLLFGSVRRAERPRRGWGHHVSRRRKLVQESGARVSEEAGVVQGAGCRVEAQGAGGFR